MTTEATQPIDSDRPSTASRLAVAPSWKDDRTGATFVHDTLREVLKPWEAEAHIPPIRAKERFGDVESWCRYVTLYGRPGATLLTWSEAGLRAVLDYHGEDQTPNRCQWEALHPFERSPQWLAWERLANGAARGQRQTLEALEDHAPDIVEPDAATLAGILRKLRATASAQADTELLADGSSRVTWKKSTAVTAGESVLPAEIQIAIPALKGHTEERDGKRVSVLYGLAVRIRVGVDDDAHLSLRLSMPAAERVLEAAYADRVAAAQAQLGAGWALLRGAAGS